MNYIFNLYTKQRQTFAPFVSNFFLSIFLTHKNKSIMRKPSVLSELFILFIRFCGIFCNCFVPFSNYFSLYFWYNSVWHFFFFIKKRVQLGWQGVLVEVEAILLCTLNLVVSAEKRRNEGGRSAGRRRWKAVQ